MTDVSEYDRAIELWETLRALAVESDAISDLAVLAVHKPYTGVEYILCAECGDVLWRRCPELRRVSDGFGISVGVGMPCPFSDYPCPLDVRTHYHYSARPGDPMHVVRYGSDEDKAAHPPHGLRGRM